MKKKLLLLIIWVFVAIPTLAQDSIRIIILSTKVSEVIDKNESEQYEIFKQYKNFSKVFFYKTIKDEYYGNFSIVQPDGSTKDTIIRYAEYILFSLAEKIENFEKIQAGDYEWGQNPPKLIIKGEGEITFQDFLLKEKEIKNSLYKIELDTFRKQDNLIEIVTYPKFSAGVGLGIYDPNFDNLKNAFYLLERQLEEEGYSFDHHYDDNFTVNPLLYLFLKIEFIKRFELLFEISDSFSDIDFKSVLISLLYNYQVFNETPLFACIGAGAGSYYFSLKKEYYISLKNGGTLESINAEGGKFVSNISVGIKYEFTKSLDISLFGNYVFVPKMETIIETGDKTAVELKGFSSSLRFSIGF